VETKGGGKGVLPLPVVRGWVITARGDCWGDTIRGGRKKSVQCITQADSEVTELILSMWKHPTKKRILGRRPRGEGGENRGFTKRDVVKRLEFSKEKGRTRTSNTQKRKKCTNKK